MSEPAFVAETLAWCNEKRAEKKLDPLSRLPKGSRRNGDSCPCGKATGLFVSSKSFYIGGIRSGGLPFGVERFVEEFDQGNLPQYDETLSNEGHYFDAEGNSGTLDEVQS